jgi:threonine synthase
MNYFSTRGEEKAYNPSQALIKGIADDKGLYVPEQFELGFDIDCFTNKKYYEIAEVILKEYFSGSGIDIAACTQNAYNTDNFYTDEPVKIKYTQDKIFLELFHGKTAAFKDMALSILPYLMKGAMKAQKLDKKIVILTATSGDTGKSAMEAFKDIEEIDIIVFYPSQGVSAVQKRHMQSQEGKNIYVIGIEGNFDDAQTAVKKVFDNIEVRKQAEKHRKILSSANSINIGRLFPQTVYYWAAYTKLIQDGKIKKGEKINFCVPTGNFGNILAGYYASRAGLPVGKFICASNENNVLTDFIQTGIYDKNRLFKKTISPSMDILISSNLERLLYHLSDNNGTYTTGLMERLSAKGKYEVTNAIKEKIQNLFYGGFADEEKIKEIIAQTYEKDGYVIDPHTAAATYVYERYMADTADSTPTVILSTANAYKFADSVLDAIFHEKAESLQALDELSKRTNVPTHPALNNIVDKQILHNKICKAEEIKDVVTAILKEN